ncbi:MAG: hypothetical protein B6229_03350 [Spirochaetaceae bacterium 4572_7]|nr:MAG: hypothetical protein B6229_03350 [Spirochaetaceae bacterium 4572_7]
MPSFVGIETQKAIDNWGVGQTPPELIKAYEVLDQIIAGEHNNLFLIPLKQGGAGTSLNMNMNEVITYLVNNQSIDEKVDYLEDINRFQSTNDTFNTAVTIVFLRHLEQAEALVVELQEALVEKETSGSSKVIIGRTELQSALPMTISQLFSSYTGAIERDRWRFNKVKERVRCSTLGGTAIGTCFSAPSKYIFAVELELRAITGLSLPRSQNLPSDISMCDKFAEAASVYDVLSGNLFKIASDFMLYTFNGELSHPELQCGSTIMPTKINPVLLEYIKGLSRLRCHYKLSTTLL